jgi:hypothetical protein
MNNISIKRRCSILNILDIHSDVLFSYLKTKGLYCDYFMIPFEGDDKNIVSKKPLIDLKVNDFQDNFEKGEDGINIYILRAQNEIPIAYYHNQENLHKGLLKEDQALFKGVLIYFNISYDKINKDYNAICYFNDNKATEDFIEYIKGIYSDIEYCEEKNAVPEAIIKRDGLLYIIGGVSIIDFYKKLSSERSDLFINIDDESPVKDLERTSKEQINNIMIDKEYLFIDWGYSLLILCKDECKSLFYRRTPKEILNELENNEMKEDITAYIASYDYDWMAQCYFKDKKLYDELIIYLQEKGYSIEYRQDYIWS